MELSTFQTLAEIVKGGGPVVLIIAVWVAFKAGQTAKIAVSALEDAVKALKEIRDLATASVPKLDAIAEQIDKVEADLTANGLKLDKLIPRAA